MKEIYIYISICEHFEQMLRSCCKFNASNVGSLPGYKGDVYKKWFLRNMLARSVFLTYWNNKFQAKA